MLARRFVKFHDIGIQSWNGHFVGMMCSTWSISTGLPRKLKKDERKPWVTHINLLKRMARKERKQSQMVKEKILRPPENGLLIKELIPIAHQLYASRRELFACVARLAKTIPVYTCSFCGEVHVGHPPHNIKTCNVAGSHASKEHSWKIGVDIPEYPTRRRIFPAYKLAGKIIDFEKKFPKEGAPGKDINAYGFWEKRKKSSEVNKLIDMHCDDAQGIADRGMEAWENMRSGASKLMQKYAVQTCGYCPEVQVGPKGHRVRNCQAFKHQMRDGQHAWQEATVDDLIPPVYVWHVQDHKSGRPLVNRLKRYYGMLPAVVELFAQAGAKVSDNYAGVMREDVAVPKEDEEKWVV